MVNVFWLNLTATTHAVADLGNVVDAMVTAFNTRFGPDLSGNYVTTGSKATWLYASGQAIEYHGTYNLSGSHTGNEVSEAACIVVNWAINDYYRGGHPRSYLAGAPSAVTSDFRTVSPSYASTMAGHGNSWISDVNALTHGGISAVQLGTVRFASGNAWLSPPVFRAYQSCSVRLVFGTQRRRYAAY